MEVRFSSRLPDQAAYRHLPSGLEQAANNQLAA